MQRKQLKFSSIGLAFVLAGCQSLSEQPRQESVGIIGQFGGVTIAVSARSRSTQNIVGPTLQSASSQAPLASGVTEVTLEGDNGHARFLDGQMVVRLPAGIRDVKGFLKLKGYDVTVIADGNVPPPPDGRPLKRAVKPLDIAVVKLQLHSADSNLLAKRLSDRGIRGKVVFADQSGLDLFGAALELNETVATTPNFVVEPQGAWPEQLRSGFTNGLPSASADYNDASQDPALTAMRVSTPSGAWSLNYGGTPLDGRNTWIAIIDTGFTTTNFDIAGTDAIYQTAFPPRTVWGYDFTQNDYDVNDADMWPNPPFSNPTFGYHGTRVAAAAAAGRGNHYGIAGVAPRANLMLFRVGESNNVNWGSVTRAINTAIAWGADVINISAGAGFYWGQSWYNPMNGPIEDARNRGLITVVAAGNGAGYIDGQNAFYRFLPADYNGSVITVGGHDQSGYLGRAYINGTLTGSNTGPSVDIFAPGGNQSAPDVTSLPSTPTPEVIVDLYNSLGIPNINCSVYPYCVNVPEDYQGLRRREFFGNATSIASPYVAGTVALMKQIRKSISLNEAMTLLRNTARWSSDPNINSYGGLVNTEAVLRAMGAN